MHINIIRHGTIWRLAAIIAFIAVFGIFGCVSSTIQKDYYSKQASKGYILLTTRMESGWNVPMLKVYQDVDGKKHKLGGLQAGGLSRVYCAWHILATAPPGKATFYFRDDIKEHSVTVDVYECATTRVTLVFSDPTIADGFIFYKNTFEVDKPISGNPPSSYSIKGSGLEGMGKITGFNAPEGWDIFIKSIDDVPTTDIWRSFPAEVVVSAGSHEVLILCRQYVGGYRWFERKISVDVAADSRLLIKPVLRNDNFSLSVEESGNLGGGLLPK